MMKLRGPMVVILISMAPLVGIMTQVYHRLDGPATQLDKMVSWWINGELYSFEEWCIKLNKTGNELVLLQAAYV
jgi:hypothetical protein